MAHALQMAHVIRQQVMLAFVEAIIDTTYGHTQVPPNVKLVSSVGREE